MKTFKSLRENDLLKSVQAAAKSAGIKLHHDTRSVAQRKADTDKMLADRAAAKPKVTPTQMPRKSPEQHMADMHKQIAKSYSDHKPGQYVGDSVELEGDELFEGHYEDADEHESKANDAHSQGDMLGYHTHMANHHDSMSQWHEEKGRGFHADKHAEKADMHGDKATQIAQGVTEAKSAEIRMYNALQKARQDREKAEAEKERLRKGGEELLNPVKKPAPMEPVKEGMFDFLSHPSAEKKKPKLDYTAVRQSAQVRNKTKSKVFNGPDEYNKAKAHNFAEEIETILNPLIEAANAIDKGEYDYEGQMARTQLQTILRNSKDLIDMISDEENMPEWVQSKITLAQDYISTVRDYIQSKEELEEGTFKYHMDKAIAADQKGDTKRKAQHLANARTAKFAMKSTDYAKNSDLLAKHRQMSEEIVHTRTGANGTKYHIKQESPNDFSVHRESNGKLKHIDTYGSLNRAKQVLDNEVKEAVMTEEKPGLYANIHAKRKRIAAGSGERMRKPGSKGAPTASAFKQAQKTVKENIDAGIDEGLARLISKSIKNVAAVKPSPQEKADIRLNKLNK